jgi:hypothetical protein
MIHERTTRKFVDIAAVLVTFAIAAASSAGCAVVAEEEIDESEPGDEHFATEDDVDFGAQATCADAARVPHYDPPRGLVTIIGCRVAEGPFADALRCLQRQRPNARCNPGRTSFRSRADQQALVCQLGCYTRARGRGAACGTLSNHQKGEAADLNGRYVGLCGLRGEVRGEPWHHSLTGR